MENFIFCAVNKSPAGHHCSLKLCLKLKYLKIAFKEIRTKSLKPRKHSILFYQRYSRYHKVSIPLSSFTCNVFFPFLNIGLLLLPLYFVLFKIPLLFPRFSSNNKSHWLQVSATKLLGISGNIR